MTIFFSLALLGMSLSLYGNNQELLNILVEKGYLSQEEASRISNESAPTGKVTVKDNVKLKVGGNLQAQWNYINSDIDNQSDPRGGPSAENSIHLRRVQVSFNADLGYGWAGLVVTDFARNDAQIDQAHISKVINDATTFYAGYKKAPFSFEETAPNAKTKTVERSALNRFFIDDLNWAARVTGLQLHHKHHKQPLSYALAITNIDQNNPSLGSDDDGNGENSLAYWARIGYDIPINEGNVHFGFDIGFMPEDAVLQYDPSSITLSDRDAWVYSLYGQFTLSQFELL